MTLLWVLLNQVPVINELGINVGKKLLNPKDISSVKVFSEFSLMELKNVLNYITIAMNAAIV
jgi:hypothetical protein